MNADAVNALAKTSVSLTKTRKRNQARRRKESKSAIAAKDVACLPTIYCISLLSRADRRKRMQQRFAAQPNDLKTKVNFLDATAIGDPLIDKYVVAPTSASVTGASDETKASDVPPLPRGQQKNPWGWPVNYDAIWGCFISHLRALRALVDSKESEAIVIEDDVMLRNSFVADFFAVRRNIPDEAQIVLLSYLLETKEQLTFAGIDPTQKNLVTGAHLTWGAQMYLVRRSHAVDCLKRFDKPFYAFPSTIAVHERTSELITRCSQGLLVSPILAIEESVLSIGKQSSIRGSTDSHAVSFARWGVENFLIAEEAEVVAAYKMSKSSNQVDSKHAEASDVQETKEAATKRATETKEVKEIKTDFSATQEMMTETKELKEFKTEVELTATKVSGGEKESKVIRVRALTNWTSRQYLYKYLLKMSADGQGRWGNLQLVAPTETRQQEMNDLADVYVVLNHPAKGDSFVPERTIVMQMEPECARNVWPGPWAKPEAPQNKGKFLDVFDTATHHNNVEWHLSKSHAELVASTGKIEKTDSGLLSAILSLEKRLPGHIKRLAFIPYLEKVKRFDLYGRNRIDSPCYRGPLPFAQKEQGLFPYRYTFAAENSSERNYWTEKIADAILSECLCFYWGCPNLGDFIDERAFIRIDLDKPDEALAIIQKCIEDDEWSKRIEHIRAAKLRILNEQQFFPTLARLVDKAQKAKML
jgi:GR25 family glycosyltransferase involved in LPS biosynthesis